MKTYHELMRELIENYMTEIKKFNIPLNQYKVWYNFIDAYPEYNHKTKKIIKTFSPNVAIKVMRIKVFLRLAILGFTLYIALIFIGYSN